MQWSQNNFGTRTPNALRSLYIVRSLTAGSAFGSRRPRMWRRPDCPVRTSRLVCEANLVANGGLEARWPIHQPPLLPPGGVFH